MPSRRPKVTASPLSAGGPKIGSIPQMNPKIDQVNLGGVDPNFGRHRSIVKRLKLRASIFRHGRCAPPLVSLRNVGRSLVPCHELPEEFPWFSVGTKQGNHASLLD